MALEIIKGPENAPLDSLRQRLIAVLGYGNQGRAHALNLRDSGLSVVVGSRMDGPGCLRAREDSFETAPISDAVAQADLIIMALPDEWQAEVYEHSILPHLRPGAVLGFLHGFAIRYELIRPSEGLGVIMVAPKGPGATLRQRFQQGLGIPCLFAVFQDTTNHVAESIGLAWAGGIGCARAGIIRTTFAAETETDLFGEQTVLVGGMVQLIQAAFETLVEAGYPPELAYLECCHEAKQVADLVYERGLVNMMQAISNTAEFGAHRIGPRLIDDSVRARMATVLEEIRDGTFARALLDDRATGFTWFSSRRAALARHGIEPAGTVIRSLMPKPADAEGRD